MLPYRDRIAGSDGPSVETSNLRGSHYSQSLARERSRIQMRHGLLGGRLT
jgi:hypothetical protein